jgi:NAD(P)H-hydrate epimerase
LRTEGGLTYLTAEEMAEADRVTIEDFGVDVLSLMENAGSAVAGLAWRMLGGDLSGRTICCLIGKGNNGGDGLVAARHLQNRGARVCVTLGGKKEEMRDVPARQLAIVEKMEVEMLRPESGFGDAELLVDALLGYSSRGSPRGPTAELIRSANNSGIRTLAVDIPSGLDATTGEPGEPCIVASATITLGLPKTGFLNPTSRKFCGDLYLADISMPREVYERFPGGMVDFGKDALKQIR